MHDNQYYLLENNTTSISNTSCILAKLPTLSGYICFISDSVYLHLLPAFLASFYYSYLLDQPLQLSLIDSK